MSEFSGYDDWKTTEDTDPVADTLDWHARQLQHAEDAGYADGWEEGCESSRETVTIDALSVLGRQWLRLQHLGWGDGATARMLATCALELWAKNPIRIQGNTDTSNAEVIEDMLDHGKDVCSGQR